jgi:hypothetical protein
MTSPQKKYYRQRSTRMIPEGGRCENGFYSFRPKIERPSARTSQPWNFAGRSASRNARPSRASRVLYEVRSNISSGRIARVFFILVGSQMVLLHGFVKKTQKTLDKELKLAAPV